MTGTIHRPLQIALAALSAGLTLSAGSAPAAPLTSDWSSRPPPSPGSPARTANKQ